jgi:Flp pilus assembly pilin Flp
MTKRISSKFRQLGQGMSEYIIITALIAVAAIGVFASFGDVLTNQTAAMALEMAGQDGTDRVDDAETDADRAETYAGQDDELNNYNTQNLDD